MAVCTEVYQFNTVVEARRQTVAARCMRCGPLHCHPRRRFPPVALKWAAALLKHCDEPQHGIDLLGKDHFLLGKLLVTLGELEGGLFGNPPAPVGVRCLFRGAWTTPCWASPGRA